MASDHTSTHDGTPVSDIDVSALLAGMAEELRSIIRTGQQEVAMVGIRTGGVWVAEQLHAALDLATSLGALNINFYRDDFTRIGMHPQVTPSVLPFEVEGRHIVLVDDVLYTGRTIRAALNELFDYGRPARVTLAALVERNGRDLPIQADVSGMRITLEAKQQIKLSGPTPLALALSTRL
ncbi:MAG: bifunctional pyr operon transcriptional regulator/uracil phosphoribosyltransferase PyrR [Pseudomonadota bacterium]